MLQPVPAQLRRPEEPALPRRSGGEIAVVPPAWRSGTTLWAPTTSLRWRFVAGGAALAGGVVLYLVAPSGSTRTGLRVTPSVSAGAAGVHVSGRF